MDAMHWRLWLSAFGLAACGNVSSSHPDAGANPGLVETCTASTAGTVPADENGDGQVDEGCAWRFGTPHWIPPVAGTAWLTSYVEPSWISSDGLRLYLIMHTGGDASSRVWLTTRADRRAQFHGLVPVTGLDLGSYVVTALALSADEREAYVTAQQSGTTPPPDLFRTTRASTTDSFAALARVDALSTPAVEERPTLRADGLELLFTSGRKLRRAVRASTGEAFSAASDIEGLPTGEVVGSALSADGHTLFFNGKLAGAVQSRLYRSERADVTSGSFGDPALVNLAVPDSANAFYPVLSEATRELYFGSDQPWSPTYYAVWRAEICRDGACPTRTIDCPSGGVRSADQLHCYSKLPSLQTAADAEASCVAQGGHLVSIQSQAEQTAVWTAFPSSGTEYRWIGSYDHRGAVPECNTLGAHGSVAFPCAWGWESGETWTFATWGVSSTVTEPQDGGDGENCATVYAPYSGAWADVPCSASGIGLCETSLYPTW